MAGLEDLYKEIILDHYRNPRNRGELEAPPAQRAEGFNPLCGDEVVVYLDLDATNGSGDDAIVRDIKISGQGCSISQSSASMMSQSVKGKTAAEARKLLRSFEHLMSIHSKNLGTDEAEDVADLDEAELGFDPADPTKGLGDLAALQGVVKYPVRIKCATLGWYTLRQGLDDAAAGILSQ